MAIHNFHSFRGRLHSDVFNAWSACPDDGKRLGAQQPRHHPRNLRRKVRLEQRQRPNHRDFPRGRTRYHPRPSRLRGVPRLQQQGGSERELVHRLSHLKDQGGLLVEAGGRVVAETTMILAITLRRAARTQNLQGPTHHLTIQMMAVAETTVLRRCLRSS